MGLVVTDTDKVMLGSAARSLRESVVLPAPEGDDITSKSPRLKITGLEVVLFNVLNLLSHLIDDGFEVKADSGQARITRF